MGATNTNVLTLSPKDLMISYGLVIPQKPQVLEVSNTNTLCLPIQGIEERAETQICH